MNNERIFQLSTFLGSNKEVFHLARITISSKNDFKPFAHDFPEIFWVKNGQGLLHINGEEVRLKKGVFCMIRPEDKHTFFIADDSSLVITKVVFKNEDLDHFKRRYFPDSKNFFWKSGIEPFFKKLNQEQLDELSSTTEYLMIQPRNYVNLDSFLLHIFRLLNTTQSVEQNSIPHWLLYALENYNTPDQFIMGVNGFVSLTNRSTDYVNRVLKHCLKQTLTETVNKIKLKYAAHQLTMTNIPIKIICYNCGFETLGYYYKIFKKLYGITPNEYRQKTINVY